jgi:hypothetical protein
VPIRDSLEITLCCHGMVCLLMLLMCPRGSCPRVIGLAEDDRWFRSTDTRCLRLSLSPLLGSLCQNPLEIVVTDWQKDFGLPTDIIKGCLCMSGMYDMKPVRLSKRSSYVKFTDEMEQAMSSQRHLDLLRAP